MTVSASSKTEQGSGPIRREQIASLYSSRQMPPSSETTADADPSGQLWRCLCTSLRLRASARLHPLLGKRSDRKLERQGLAMATTVTEVCLADDARECANCGAIEGLLRCSRCRQALFCSLRCQKAYWPFHKQECCKNEFADAIEQTEPKFAAWMRKHGKQAVLKDDEVDRLERAGKASCGPSKMEVMESMYGRLVPKPKEASYTAQEKARVKALEDAKALENKQRSEVDTAWAAIEIQPELGVDCGCYKWQQNQSYVEVYCKVPQNVQRKDIEVTLLPGNISVAIGFRRVVVGELFARIKVEDSLWYVEGGVLYLTLLKLHRRGNYQDGGNNAGSFWRSILKAEPEAESLQAFSLRIDILSQKEPITLWQQP